MVASRRRVGWRHGVRRATYEFFLQYCGGSCREELEIPAEPLVLAILFGCNLCFATPVAYQTNILIMTAGGYQFRDYVRAGLPLVIIMIIALSMFLVGKYDL